MDEGDRAVFVGVDVIDAWQSVHRHGRVELFPIGRLAQFEPLFGLAQFAHSGKAYGKAALGRLDHRAVFGTQNLALGCEGKRTQQADPDLGRADLEIAPFPIEQILVCIVGIDGQFVDIDQVGSADRIGPAKVAVETVQNGGRTGECAALDVEPFLRDHMRLPPGDGPFHGLVRIDDQPRGRIA